MLSLHCKIKFRNGQSKDSFQKILHLIDIHLQNILN